MFTKLRTIDTSNKVSVAPQTRRVITIDLRDVRSNDFILIGTRNTVYSFLITDSREMRGRLTGGTQTGDESDAVLLGTMIKQGRKLQPDRSTLKTNAQALFFVASSGGIKQLITSAITKLVCVRSVAGCLPR